MCGATNVLVNFVIGNFSHDDEDDDDDIIELLQSDTSHVDQASSAKPVSVPS